MYNPQVQLILELTDLIIIIDRNMVTDHNMAIGHNTGIITEPNMLSIGFGKAYGYRIIQLFEELWTIGTKVKLIWEPALNQEFTGFPTNIWIFKFFFLLVFAIKMLLDNNYGLMNLLEFKCDYFTCLLLAESQFQNSNVGGK